ncbi:MAG: KR domain-containing protein, partial [Cyanobacteria bacterium P01_G01_bin.49]
MSVLPTVLILGGKGRIGNSIAQDLLNYTQAKVIVTGRSQNRENNLSLSAAKI